MEPTARQKELYRKIAPILGVNPRVIAYGNEDNTESIYIMNCPDPTDNAVTFYCSIGLLDYPVDGRRYEILMAGYDEYEAVPNILSTCAFFLMLNGWKCTCGNVFETLVEMYFRGMEMKHILFVPPYLWEDKLLGFSVEGEPIDFTLALPISDEELEYKRTHGTEALLTVFEERSIDIFNLGRKSVL